MEMDESTLLFSESSQSMEEFDESTDFRGIKYGASNLLEECKLWDYTIRFLEDHGALRFSSEPVHEEFLSLN